MYMNSDAPSIYQLVDWITALSGLIHPDFQVPTPGGGVTRPNLFTVLIGPAGASRKSFSISQMQKRMQAAAPQRIGDSCGSAQGLITSLSDERKIQVVFDEDFGEFLAASQRGPMQQLKTFFLKAFDGGRLSHRLKGESWEATDYSFSFLTGINMELLETFATPSDFSGGLFSRFLVINSKCESTMAGHSVRIPDELRIKAEQFFTDALILIGKHCPNGTLKILPEAADLFVAWEEERMGRNTGSRGRANIAPSFARSPTLATRVAAFHALDRFCSAGGSQTRDITYADARLAINLIEEAMRGVTDVFGCIAQTPFLRKRRAVLNALPEYNEYNQWATLGTICRETGLEMREVKTVLETLNVEDAYRQGNTGTNVGYQRSRVVASDPSILVSSAPPTPLTPSSTLQPSTPLPAAPSSGYDDDEPLPGLPDEDY
jgi:hypothetical protein